MATLDKLAENEIGLGWDVVKQTNTTSDDWWERGLKLQILTFLFFGVLGNDFRSNLDIFLTHNPFVLL